MNLRSGLGDEHGTCSVAAINLALTGELTDKTPLCMSPVVGKWIVVVQDSMPTQIRNSQRWKSLLPSAAGTGRLCEQERLALILHWMWDSVLPTVQAIATEHGFGEAWARMTTERTVWWAAEAKVVAAQQCRKSAPCSVATTWSAREAADAASWAAERWARTGAAADALDLHVAQRGATGLAARAAVEAAFALRSAAADAAKESKRSARTSNAAVEAAWVAAWEEFDPCLLLEQLIIVGEKK
jgi:hypothetical protein